jgi:hypothetical protein
VVPNSTGEIVASATIGRGDPWERLRFTAEMAPPPPRECPMSAYRQTLADGRDAEMVRLGRVVLLYRTIEDGETGYWDNQRKEWVADPASARVIEEALAIAKEERAPDLITVPVPAAQGGRS